MHPDSAALTSLATTVEGVTERVTEVAERLRGGDYEPVAHDLYEVERALRTARRRLDDVVRSLAGLR